MSAGKRYDRSVQALIDPAVVRQEGLLRRMAT